MSGCWCTTRRSGPVQGRLPVVLDQHTAPTHPRGSVTNPVGRRRATAGAGCGLPPPSRRPSRRSGGDVRLGRHALRVVDRGRRVHRPALLLAYVGLPRGGARGCTEPGPDRRKTVCQRRTRPAFATPPPAVTLPKPPPRPRRGRRTARDRHPRPTHHVRKGSWAGQRARLRLVTTAGARQMSRNPTWSNIGSDKSLDTRNSSSIRSARHQTLRVIRIAPAALLIARSHLQSTLS